MKFSPNSVLCAAMRVFFLTFFLGSAPLEGAEPAVETSNPSPDPIIRVSQEGISAELSFVAGKTGSVFWTKVSVPKSPDSYRIKGTIDGLEFPFFMAEIQEKNLVFGALMGIPFSMASGEAPVRIDIASKGLQNTVLLPLQVPEKVDDENVEVLDLGEDAVRPKDPAVLKQILAEEKETDHIYSSSAPRKMWRGPFTLPLRGKINSPFGRFRVYKSHIQRRVHWGVDFHAPIGTPVLASAAGKVVLAKKMFFTGNTVILDHGYGVVTLYAHLSKIGVKEGDLVSQNKIIGKSGKSGKVTGPNLHWQAIINRVKVNPMELLKLNEPNF